MSLRAQLRVGVVGVTGALGNELLAVLEERGFPVAELLPIATQNSLGVEVDLGGRSYPVETEPPSLRGLDLLFLCVPADAALDWLRLALHAQVPTLDLSGALAATGQVPLIAPDLAPAPESLAAPVLALPPGPALAWAMVLAPIHAHAGLRRVIGTSLESACGAGREGLEALRAETVALFNQQDAPDPDVFPTPVAFDCVPSVGEFQAGADTRGEEMLAATLARLLGGDVRVAITSVRVPTFAGAGASLAIETERPLAPAEVRDLLAKAPGIELWDDDLPGPTTREPVGRAAVVVGRVRSDPSHPHGLLLWLSADPVRLAAESAVRLAEARLGRA